MYQFPLLVCGICGRCILAAMMAAGGAQSQCRAASVSKRSEANDRGLFEILQFLYIYVIVIVRLVCDMAQTQHEARGREAP